MGGTISVSPHPEGDWLVTSGGVCFAVSPRLGRALLPLQGSRPDEAAVRACLALDKKTFSPTQAAALASLLCNAAANPARRSRRRALWLRIPLIPSRLVASVAFRLRRLASWPALAAMASFGVAGYLGLGRIFDQSPEVGSIGRAVLPALLFFLVTALWHEFGHAAALANEGYPPGGIGAGLLFVVPVLFADVTSIGALSRSGRTRVDIAGVGFQLGLGGLLFALGSLIPGARTAGLLALFAVVWSLLPFIRSDGYWLLCDLLGVPDLERPLLERQSWLLTGFLVAFRLANIAFLLAVGGMIYSRVLHWWEKLIEWSYWPIENTEMIQQTGRILLIGMLALIGYGVLRRVTGMLRASWLDLRRRAGNPSR